MQSLTLPYIWVTYHSQQWCHSKSPSVCGSNLHCIRRWMLRWRRSWCKEGRRWHLDHLNQKRMAQLIQLGLIPWNPTWMPALRGKRRMRLRASRTVLSRLSLFHDSWDITLFNRRKFKRFEMKLSDGDVTWLAVFLYDNVWHFFNLIWFIWHNRDNYSPNKLHKSCSLPWVFRKEKAMKFDIYTPRIEICTPREATVRPRRRTRSCLKLSGFG